MSDAGLNLSVEQLNTSAVTEDSEQKNHAAPQTAGAMLTVARSQKDWTVQQVAEQLKLSARQIIALEANQFDALPKMVIVRGFIRSYAKLLKIDAEPILAKLPQESAAVAEFPHLRPALTTPFLESKLPLMGRQDPTNSKYIWGAVVLAILAAGFFAVQKLEHNGLMQKLLSHQLVSAPETVASNVSDSAELMAASPVPAIRVNSEKNTEVAASTVDKEPEVSRPAPVSEQVASNPAVVPQTLAQATPLVVSTASQPALPASVANNSAALEQSANLMKFKFRQDSWIQIKRENGTVVTSHLAKAGTEESFDVKEALQIKIGNAAGVDGTLRGTSLNIAATKESNVINLNVK
ncbi:helix-turn-helix domain-containing protein [Undibacterium sp. Rencai35W]|uniref:helix-turn-helix domain-containing protein n=1 Tax=Undibacterium sp. Rencai35W TaxID=3413046 RepID=UPI003BF11036